MLKDLLIANNKFRKFWITNLCTNFAVWMQSTLAAIAITQLSNSSFLSSMSQWATTMPIFLFGIAAGFLGDRYNKFKIMSIVCVFMAMIMITLACFIELKINTPIVIIICTFIFATCTAFRMPASQAVTSYLVSNQQIKDAAILNNFGFNIMRAAGPSIAGILVAICSLAQSCVIVAILILTSAISFWLQRHNVIESNGEKVHVLLLDVVKICIKSKAFVITSFDALFIFGCGNVIWSLLPYMAKYSFHMTSIGQGGLISLIGVGAILTIVFLPILTNRIKSHIVIYSIYLTIIIILINMCIFHKMTIVYGLLILFGLAWSSAVALLNGIIQSSFEKNIITRVVSFYLMIMYIAQALGALIFGYISSIFSINTSLLLAGTVLFISLVARFYCTTVRRV